jgi:hypothetical protein
VLGKYDTLTIIIWYGIITLLMVITP